MLNFLRINCVLFILVMSCFQYTFSQEIISIEIPWESPKEVNDNGEKIWIPSIVGQDLSHKIPNYFWSKKITSSNHSTLSILNVQTVNAEDLEKQYLEKENISISSDLKYEMKVTNAGTDVYAVLNLLPFVRENGVIKRITNIELKINHVPRSTNVVQKSFAASSVLASGSGTWYKIGISTDGIHKIDKPFLEACGISTTGLDPHSINIYGNGDGKLPELNSTPRTDDLAKNAIIVAGESDGVFDDGDYILFYAWGPSRWYTNGTTGFSQDYNIYSDVSYYFININPSDTPLRLSSINSSPAPRRG